MKEIYAEQQANKKSQKQCMLTKSANSKPGDYSSSESSQLANMYYFKNENIPDSKCKISKDNRHIINSSKNLIQAEIKSLILSGTNSGSLSSSSFNINNSLNNNNISGINSNYINNYNNNNNSSSFVCKEYTKLKINEVSLSHKKPDLQNKLYSKYQNCGNS